MIGTVRPGDTLVIATAKLMSDADGEKYRQRIERNLPGVRIVVIAPAIEMAVYRDGVKEEGHGERQPTRRDELQ
jgi:hypothetical protein